MQSLLNRFVRSSRSPTNANEQPMRVGGYSSTPVPADYHIQQIVDQLRYEINYRSGYRLNGPMIAVSYTSQVVAGTNYRIKVNVGGNQYVHLTVFQPLPYIGAGPQLTNIEFNKSYYDPL